MAPRRCPYFDVEVGLVWSHDPVLSVAYATGRASHARQVKGDDPDKKGYPGLPGWGFGVGLTTPHSKKTYCYESRAKKVLFDRPKPTAGCSANVRRRRRIPTWRMCELVNWERLTYLLHGAESFLRS